MLQEKLGIYQRPGEDQRRWFEDDAFRLIVWVRGNEIVAFELSCDMPGDCHVIKWSKAQGLKTYLSDEGDGKSYKPQPAVALTHDPTMTKEQMQLVAARFLAESKEMDTAMSSFVFRQLVRYDPNPVKW